MKEKRPILKNRFYLYLTEFFSGMSVMAVELGASRLMAPYFSSSQIVWTIIIGTIMIAMALGNIYGGRSADKNPNPDKLYGRIIIAAIWIALIPVFGKYIILGISALLIFAVNSNFLIIAGFAACMVIFVFPLFLLGTVTPCLVKYTVDNLDDNGKLVGNLNASNTIGSIIGTFVPTFISIPMVGTSITFLIFAGILLLLAIIYFMSGSKNFFKVRKVPVSVVIFINFSANIELINMYRSSKWVISRAFHGLLYFPFAFPADFLSDFVLLRQFQRRHTFLLCTNLESYMEGYQ